MAVIKEYMNGECRIIVHDDAICPPEKVKEIVDNCSRIVLDDLRAREVRKERDASAT